ncbi:MAG TPA: anhydro-N-acetylmuramic acid kinase [Verrucomicrobiae bacterium]|nr:anhydro-N-acetylmuramic acid kinase [Verrucomicrobiae bacterium]
MKERAMIVAGVMSGTSADGINVALVRIGERAAAAHHKRLSPDESRSILPRHTIALLGQAEFPYPPNIRAAILGAMNAESARVADLARLNFLLGELYADAIAASTRRFRTRIDLVGCHGQTLYHQARPQRFLGKNVAATWQTGEGAVVAARLKVPVVSDFRPADIAAGGQGAPLVPYLDYILFRDTSIGRIAQNVGGIANLTAIPAGASPGQIIAFDTGPGNMVIDAVTEALFRQRFDRGGRIAARGTILEPVLRKLLQRAFFRAKPPKTAGREQFGRQFVREFLRRCERARPEDVVATATALTVRSIADAVQRFLIPRSPARRPRSFREMILSGGGSRNRTLVSTLGQELAPLEIRLRLSDEFGLPSEAKEAVAFAVLAYETWHRRPSNVPPATGAKRPAVLGKISYA